MATFRRDDRERSRKWKIGPPLTELGQTIIDHICKSIHDDKGIVLLSDEAGLNRQLFLGHRRAKELADYSFEGEVPGSILDAGEQNPQIICLARQSISPTEHWDEIQIRRFLAF